MLLIEANPLVQGMLKAALAGEVSALEFAASLDEATAVLATRRFDLLVVEGRLLTAADPEPFQAIGGLAEQAKGAQVVVLWPGAPEDADGLRRAGVHLVVPKPVGTADLVQQLKTLCSSAGAEPEMIADAPALASVRHL